MSHPACKTNGVSCAGGRRACPHPQLCQAHGSLFVAVLLRVAIVAAVILAGVGFTVVASVLSAWVGA